MVTCAVTQHTAELFRVCKGEFDMILDSYETLHCDAGWRKFSFLRLVAQDGTTGISEYNESYGSPGLTQVIEGLLQWVVGKHVLLSLIHI